MSTVSIFLLNQNPAQDEAPHRCTRSFARQLSVLFPYLVTYRPESSLLQLKTKDAWSAVKARLRPKTVQGVLVTQLLPPGPAGPLMLSYPPSPRETDGKERQKKLWMGATKF